MTRHTIRFLHRIKICAKIVFFLIIPDNKLKYKSYSSLKVYLCTKFRKFMMKKHKNGGGVSTLRQAQGSTTKSFKMRNIIMAILTGGLLTAAWPTWGIAPLAFIGFVPLLLLENRAAQGEKMRLFWISYLAFLINLPYST